MELLSEQKTAADTLVNLNQPVQEPEQFTLPPDSSNFCPQHCQAKHSVSHRWLCCYD